MEVLRSVLKILYSRQDPKLILDRVKNARFTFVDEIIDEFSFQKLLCVEMAGSYTLDNARTAMQHLKEKWLNAVEDDNLMYVHRKSVFNVLLHFTSEVLTERDLTPVCHYEHLLRWHDLSSYLSEDLLTTSFLAARDICHHKVRKTFCWPPVIAHDNRTLNELFKRSMKDLHFHLNGSSLNFEVNWLSLMNKVSGWKQTFDSLNKLQQERVQLFDEQSNEPFYLCIMKSAALRVLLFEYVIQGKSFAAIPPQDVTLVTGILYAQTADAAMAYVHKLDIVTQRLRHIYGQKYRSKNGSLRIPDYAVLARLTNGISKDNWQYALSTLSGERYLLYELFYDIYAHPTKIDKRIVAYFYAYLLYKIRFRAEFVQNNKKVGFANFAKYEKRKSLFIRTGSVYDSLLSMLAVLSFLGKSENRWLEVRITPKDKCKKLVQHIRKTKLHITDQHFVSEKLANFVESKYGLILHFIKSKDNDPKQEQISQGKCRHYNARYEIKRQAHAIMNLRNSLNVERCKILGIDAANSEIFARPEVFAQAFRYLRESTCEVCGADVLSDLGMTYHVGEDYLDVVDGLRAVDELIHYMQFRNGDRLGHAMVLGIDANAYYSRAHYNIILPKQVLLDNIVWLYYKGKNLQDFVPICHTLETLFEKYCYELYGHLQLRPTMWDYYQSWLLRGDNPQCYFHKETFDRHKISSRWGLYNLNNVPIVRQAAKNTIACSLYRAYHFDPKVRKYGQETVSEKMPEAVVHYVSAVQQLMLDEIERKNIRVECNPTSNLKIGHFESYSTHPIFRMYNKDLPTCELPHSISVTVNTDDKGIFSTSLEREYSLLALSMEKKYVTNGKCSPRVIYDWLDRIRQMSEEQKF